MVMKAVCVLKGAGETAGTVHFEQEVGYYTLKETRMLFNVLRIG